jgi:hypothetical protein
LCSLTWILTAETIKTAHSVFIGKSKIGYLQTIREENNDTVTTTVNEYTCYKRGKYGDKIPTLTEIKVQEKKNGELLSFVTTYNENELTRIYHGTMSKNGILNIQEKSSLDSKQFQYSTGPDFFLFEGIRIHFESSIPVSGSSVSYSSLGIPLMELEKVTRTVTNKEEVDLLTGTEQLYRVENRIQSEHNEAIMISFVDESWNMKKMVLPAGAMQITMLECPFDSVTSGISDFDVLTSSAIEAPPNSIGLQSSVYAEYSLVIPEKFNLPSTDEQKITSSKNNTVQLSVTKSYLPPDVLYPLKEIPSEMQNYLQPSRYIESEDPVIQNMAKLAVRKTKRAKRAVNRIRRFVQFNIIPTLSTPYATALETAKQSEGDCTEFALLTTALCRAAHIPARVVTGIAYLPFSGNFYYHAWTQVFIEGKWYSVDAALRRFDPGHIALSLSIDGAPDSKVNDCLGILKINQLDISNIAPVQ